MPAAGGPLSEAWGALRADDLTGCLLPPDRSLPLPPATVREAWSPGRGVDAATADDQIARATADLGRPWPLPRASDFARYFSDGDRFDYEEQVFARQHRLSRAVFAAAVTLEGHWLDEVADGVTLLCEQSTWCWPAHDDTFERHGRVVPTVTEPFLDLGAGEVAGQLAWTDHVLGDRLDARYPGLRDRMRHEIRTRVLDPFLTRRDWHWLGRDEVLHNWSPWIHGNVLLAALRFASDDDRPVLVAAVVEGLDRYAAALPDDGTIDEGYAYWWNGACRLLEALDVLRHATGGKLDATGVPVLSATVGFPHSMHLGDDWYLNLADGQARPPADQPWPTLHRVARVWGDEQAARHAAAQRVPGGPVATEREGLGRLLLAAHDPAWREAVPAGSPLPAQVWFPSTQVLLARERAGTPTGLTLAAKGGHNGENHNHNDVGSVVVALDGIPVVVDAGRPTYTRQTFGPGRYGIWTMQSSWHSVPEIRGTPQSPGREYAAREAAAELREPTASLRLDLATAYPRADVTRWWRTATLDRTRSCARITDQWQLADVEGAPSSVVHLLLAGTVDLHPGRVEVTPMHGDRRAVLRWTPWTLEANLTRMTLDDPMLTGVWGDTLTRLSIDVGADNRGELTVTVEVDR